MAGPPEDGSHVTAIPLGRPLPDASSDQPGRRPGNGPVLRPRTQSVSPLFGLAPGGVCRAAPVTGRAVRSYRTLSPLPAAEAAGGLLSVALSLGSPPPDVIRRRASVEPGLSSPILRSKRPSGRLAGTSSPKRRARSSARRSGGSLLSSRRPCRMTECLRPCSAAPWRNRPRRRGSRRARRGRPGTSRPRRRCCRRRASRPVRDSACRR